MHKYEKTVPIQAGNILISSNENSYEYLFNDIKKMKHLFISTFNYYMENEYVSKIISNIRNVSDIRVVFNAYKLETVHKIIKRSIEINPYVQLYYYNRNHSKIISTGNKMYIGSANYTGYSKNNYEVGVDINDERAIETIENEIFYNLFEYNLIISDPIQPLIIYSLITYNDCQKVMNWIEWYFEKTSCGNVLTSDDVESIDYRAMETFINTCKSILIKIKEYIAKYETDFLDNGILLSNFIDIILKKLEDKDAFDLGNISKLTIGSYYEDYMNCLPQYKDEFWYESMLEIGNNLLMRERNVFSNYKSLLNMFIYLKVNWLKNYTKRNKDKYYISSEFGVSWLDNSYVINAVNRMLIE